MIPKEPGPEVRRPQVCRKCGGAMVYSPLESYGNMHQWRCRECRHGHQAVLASIATATARPLNPVKIVR